MARSGGRLLQSASDLALAGQLSGGNSVAPSVFSLVGADNDSVMCDKCPGIDRCGTCGYATAAEDYVNPEFVLKRDNYDISYTYDGACIVSSRFRELCVRERYDGIAFLSLPRVRYFFRLVVRGQLTFDPVSRGTRFENLCTVCGRYESVVGAYPAFLKAVPIPGEGIYRSDLEFGSGDGKSPVLLVPTKTKRKMEREKIRGAIFEAAKVATV